MPKVGQDRHFQEGPLVFEEKSGGCAPRFKRVTCLSPGAALESHKFSLGSCVFLPGAKIDYNSVYSTGAAISLINASSSESSSSTPSKPSVAASFCSISSSEESISMLSAITAIQPLCSSIECRQKLVRIGAVWPMKCKSALDAALSLKSPKVKVGEE